ncbi:hypothetical protein K501DRAFT_328505 [Backusella circina FSU 941]|nr:hypothetical protein K501DRAFT_328505 [Backusella circina FSU 941]
MTAINETIVNRLKEELTCVICQDIYDDPYSLLPCLHTYCKGCADVLIGARCPICRVSSVRTVRSFTVQSFLDILTQAQDILTSITITPSISTNNKSNQQNGTVNRNNKNSTTHEIPAGSGSGSGSTGSTRKRPCRYCDTSFLTANACRTPITNTNQSGDGHIQCYSCREYMPSKSMNGTEPDLSQSCNFCGNIYCDDFWGCKNKSNSAKLFILDEIEDIKHFISDVEHITARSHGHLNRSEIKLLENYINEEGETWTSNWKSCLYHFDENIYRTAVARQMVPMAEQLYNTRRIPTDEEEVEDMYYENMEEIGVMPSKHLRACYTCAVNIVNGQFYYYWSRLVGTGICDDREKCSEGHNCTRQWISTRHAEAHSHTEPDASN